MSGVAEGVAAVVALEGPLRRKLFRLLAASAEWTSRDRAAEVSGLPRSVVAFHLDKLAEAGLLEVRFERVGDRTGPGAGRPAKLYRAATSEVSASVPGRRYDLAGSILAEAVEAANRSGGSIADAVRSAAVERGRGVDPESAPLLDVLARVGYEPVVGSGGGITLGNCPFHRLAEERREVVCDMNLAFVTGLIEAVGADSTMQARLEPAAARCCVRVMPQKSDY